KGDRVAILSTTRLEWALADMAILGAQGATVPIYPSSTPDDVSYLLNHSEASVAFVENKSQLAKIVEVRDKFPNLKKIILFDSDEYESGPESEWVISLGTLIRMGSRMESRDTERFNRNLRSATPDDLIAICYTSGT